MDIIINNYFSLGEAFDGECQTADLYNCEARFWISPAGELFEYDDLGAWKWEEKEPSFGFNFGYVKKPTGEHIKLRPKRFTDTIAVFPAHWNGSSDDWPQARLYIKDGKIESYTITTLGARQCQA